VRLGGVAGAADVLLVTEGLDLNGILHRALRVREQNVNLSQIGVCVAYPCGWSRVVACRRCQHPASCPRFLIAQDRWPAPGRWGWFQAQLREGGGRLRT
jgi:hypothetical protein